jgi:ABC-type transport system substrate-binding protein
MREALAHAIDREQLIKVVFAGATEIAVPAYQHENPALETHDPTMNELPIWEYDLEKALALLEEEGWIDTDGDGIRDKDGQKLRLDILTPAADPNRVKIGVILATIFRQELGIDATTTRLDWGVLIERTDVLPPENDVQAYVIGGYSGVNGLYYLFSSTTWGPGGNSSFYSNPAVDELFERALATLDRAERIELWKQAQRLIYQDLPQIPLYFDFAIAAAKPNVHGYVPWSRICDMYTQVWMEVEK